MNARNVFERPGVQVFGHLLLKVHGEVYSFLWRRGEKLEIMAILQKFADDAELSLTWDDVALVSEKLEAHGG